VAIMRATTALPRVDFRMQTAITEGPSCWLARGPKPE
jgi:hypothetical protein